MKLPANSQRRLPGLVNVYQVVMSLALRVLLTLRPMISTTVLIDVFGRNNLLFINIGEGMEQSRSCYGIYCDDHVKA